MTGRRAYCWITLLLIAGCGILLHSRSNPQSLRVRLENGVLMNVSLQLSPPVEWWDMGGQNEYFGGGYHLRLEDQSEAAGGRMKVIVVRDDKQKFTVEDFHLALAVDGPGSLRSVDLQPRAESASELSGVGHRVLFRSHNTQFWNSVCFGSESRGQEFARDRPTKPESCRQFAGDNRLTVVVTRSHSTRGFHLTPICLRKSSTPTRRPRIGFR